MDDKTVYFEALYDRHVDSLFRHLYTRLNDRERAMELTQELFTKVWQHLVADKHIEYEKAFLYRIAHNLFINEIRTDKRVNSLEAMRSESDFDVVDQTAQTGLQADQSELLRYLTLLKSSYRDVLVMHYIDSLSVLEIATLTEENETTISMRLKRAREKLHVLYQTKSTKKL